MRYIQILLAILFLGAHFAAPTAFAQTKPAPGSDVDDDLGIDMKAEEKAAEKPGRKGPAKHKSELPPIEMIYVKGGCYEMGDFTGDGDDDEIHVHTVCVSDFYMGATEVTQELYETVMGFNPSFPRDPKLPANNMSWPRATSFIKRLNDLTNGFYRLPTEAEWEYAARSGGKKHVWPGTSDEAELGEFAWYSENSDGKLHPVKGLKPNALGLYDMAGNVKEWVEDYYDYEYYEKSPMNDPMADDFTLWRSIRGGSYADPPHKSRTSFRYAIEPINRSRVTGFRLAE